MLFFHNFSALNTYPLKALFQSGALRLSGLVGLAIAMASCGSSPRMAQETEYLAGSHRIIEQVYAYDGLARVLSDEEYYQRIYTVEAYGQEIARLEGLRLLKMSEAENLVHMSPKKVGDLLAVASDSQIWILQPGQDVIHFNPYGENSAWSDGDQTSPVDETEESTLYPRTIRGDVSHVVSDFDVVEGKWQIDYIDPHNAPKGYNADGTEFPKSLNLHRFISEDQGKTFVLKTLFVESEG